MNKFYCLKCGRFPPEADHSPTGCRYLAVEMLPTLKTHRDPPTGGIGYLKLKSGSSEKTVTDITCNLDFNEHGELIGVEFMSWPKDVKQHEKKPQ